VSTSEVQVSTEPISRDRVFRFGPFELSEREGELRKSGVRIKLQEQPFRVLVELVANAGNLVSREDLHKKLWPADTFVDFDVGLNSAIRKLRQALGDDADNPHYIETLAKRGYRFIAPVADVVPAVPPKSRDSPVQAPDTLSGDGTGSETREESQRKPRRWYWVLAACVLALVSYGALLALRRANTPPPPAIERQITANPREAPITAAVVSPDGKYVAYSDTTGVYVRHIDTGETRPLPLPSGFDAIPTSWFPDGTHLLLGSGEALNGFGPPSKDGIPSLWKVSLLGGSPQRLVDNASGGSVSPDGSEIAFLRDDAMGSPEIWVMATDGSNLQRVAHAGVPVGSTRAGDTVNRVFESVFVSAIAWSPDGKRLAYVKRFEATSPGPSEDKHSLETVDLLGGQPKVLKTSTHLLNVVTWATDGRLLFGYRNDPASERVNTAIWSLRINQESGEPEGKEVQLTTGAGRLCGLSVTRDGKRLVLWRENLSPTVFLAEIDAETHSLMRPRRLTLDENTNIVMDWTPDSQAVLFSSNRNGTSEIFRQGIDQVVPEVLVEGHGLFQPRVSPNGKEILYLAGYNPQTPAQPVSVMAVSLAGGPSRVVLQTPFIDSFQCLRNPSKLCLLTTSERVYSFDPQDGKLQPLYDRRAPGVFNLMTSPNGDQLAVVYAGSKHKITFVTLRNNESREVELPESLGIGMDWMSDSKGLLVTGWSTNGAPVVIGLETNGQHRVLLEGDKAIQYMFAIPSPDGRYAALQVDTRENNAWMVENF
jgi:DNA-binding winged helix-turn-helix (wHTH) protein/Tol biopolymer transport system component